MVYVFTLCRDHMQFSGVELLWCIYAWNYWYQSKNSSSVKYHLIYTIESFQFPKQMSSTSNILWSTYKMRNCELSLHVTLFVFYVYVYSLNNDKKISDVRDNCPMIACYEMIMMIRQWEAEWIIKCMLCESYTLIQLDYEKTIGYIVRCHIVYIYIYIYIYMMALCDPFILNHQGYFPGNVSTAQSMLIRTELLPSPPWYCYLRMLKRQLATYALNGEDRRIEKNTSVQFNGKRATDVTRFLLVKNHVIYIRTTNWFVSYQDKIR